jgi:hypothetical protein
MLEAKRGEEKFGSSFLQKVHRLTETKSPSRKNQFFKV